MPEPRRILGIVLLGMANAGAVATATESFYTLDLDAPRSYGYVIGDVIDLNWTLVLDPGYRLDIRNLPKPGSIRSWLNLRHVEVQADESESSFRYRVRVSYQTFRAPLTVQSLAVPELGLPLAGTAPSRRVVLPEWQFKMTPLRELSVFDASGANPILPDAEPPLPSTGGIWIGLIISLLGAVASGGWLAYREAWLPFNQRGSHFRLAQRELRRLSPQSHGDDPRKAYGVVHQALNQTLGEPLFADNLAGFLETHADYQAIGAELQAFFASSYESFFGDGSASEFSLTRLMDLCKACQRIEQARP
jgi:mxaA protein